MENTGSTVIFPAIVYNLEDAGKTYTYTLEEQDISGGYAKDKAVYTIYCEDHRRRRRRTGSGYFRYEDNRGRITESGLDQITFDNSYKAKGTWTPEASSALKAEICSLENPLPLQ